MPYVSHPVRHVRDDPVDGETIDLLLRIADDANQEHVATAVSDVGGEVLADLEFDTLEVTVPQPAVAEVCDLDGLEAVETVNTLALDLDGAGEDVEY